MVVHLIIICAILILLSWMWVDYIKSKNMIRMAKDALFPSNESVSNEIRTIKGKVETISFQSKSWKSKRLATLITTIFFLFMVGLTIIFEGYFTWMNLFVFLYIPLMIMYSFKVPSFLIFPKGIYMDERFYNWDSIVSFEILIVNLGSEAYGMFDNSPDYTELKFYIDKKYKSVYILDKSDVEKIRQLLFDFKVEEDCA